MPHVYTYMNVMCSFVCSHRFVCLHGREIVFLSPTIWVQPRMLLFLPDGDSSSFDATFSNVCEFDWAFTCIIVSVCFDYCVGACLFVCACGFVCGCMFVVSV